MGFRGPEFEEDGDALRARSLAAVKGPLAADRDDRFVPFDFPGRTPVQFETVWPATPDRRLRLAPPSSGPSSSPIGRRPRTRAIHWP